MAFENVKLYVSVEDAQSFKRSQMNLARNVRDHGCFEPSNHQITQKISRQLDKMGYVNGKPPRRKVRTETVTEYVYLSPWAWVVRQWVLIDWRMGLRKRAQTWYSFARNVFGV